MDEDEKFWEQPEDLTLDEEENNGSQKSEDQENIDEQSNAEKGETFIGKFKDAQALWDAYNNLEKEFTKKCQRLSELEKDKTEDIEKTNEEIDKKYHAFLSANMEAENFGEELKNRVLSDESLKKLDDPFSFVWAEMVFEKLKNSPDDKVISDYVLNNNTVKDMVIKNYVNQLSENKSPIMISSSGKRVGTMVSTQKPETLKDAKKVLLDLLS